MPPTLAHENVRIRYEELHRETTIVAQTQGGNDAVLRSQREKCVRFFRECATVCPSPVPVPAAT